MNFLEEFKKLTKNEKIDFVNLLLDIYENTPGEKSDDYQEPDEIEKKYVCSFKRSIKRLKKD